MSKFNFLKKLGIFSAVVLTISGCGNFDPSENEPVCIYGPPEMMGEPIEEVVEEITPAPTPKTPKPTKVVVEEEPDTEFDATVNVEPCIYGPPEMFTNRNNE